MDSVTVVLDDGGKIVTQHEYLPFGETWITEGDKKNAPKYNSQELDKESGYYFYNARHYDPEIGRFVTPDTVIDGELSTQGWNRFAYVHNNPIRYKDPTGHDAQDVLVGVQKAFEKATCEQAKETKAAWNNGKPLKAAYHAANTLGAAIPTFLLPSDRQEADMMALTAGMAPAAIKTGGAGSRLLSAASKTTVGKSIINFAEKLASKVGIKGGEEVLEKGATKSVVIGEVMDFIKKAAHDLQDKGVNAKWYQAWSKNFKPENFDLEKSLQRNERWIRDKIDKGYSIYDIGPKGSSISSPFYKLEKEVLKEMNYPVIPLKK
jgi:RHS repeat-associated protein